jgi:hypothetical protein
MEDKMPTTFDCMTCEEKPHFETRDDMLKHLTEKHGCVVGKTKFTRKPIMFLDGGGWHQQQYEWDFGTFKVCETWTSK